MFCLRNHDCSSFHHLYPARTDASENTVWQTVVIFAYKFLLQKGTKWLAQQDMITTLLRVSSRRRQPSRLQLSICENAIPNYKAPAGNSELHCPTLGDAGQVSPVFMIRSDSSTTCTDLRAGSGSRHTLPVSISFTKVKEWGSTGTSPFPPACYVRTGEGHTQWGPTAPWSTCFLTSSFKKGVHRMGREKGRCSEILPITQPTPKQPCWSWKHSSSNLIPLESAHGK